MADEEQVKSSTEETTEVEEAATDTEETETSEDTSKETESSEEDGEADAGEGKFKKAFEDQKKRAEKAETELKKLKGQKPQGGGDTSALSKQIQEANARATRAELRSAGYSHPDDHKYILDAAKRLGVDPLEAAADELVAAKLKRMAEARATADATPRPAGGGPARKSSKLPDFSKMSDAEFDEWQRKNR